MSFGEETGDGGRTLGFSSSPVCLGPDHPARRATESHSPSPTWTI